jgi:hypothetical protein
VLIHSCCIFMPYRIFCPSVLRAFFCITAPSSVSSRPCSYPALLNIGSAMTLFEPDLHMLPGHLLLQYDTWGVVSRGEPQNVSSRLPRTKSYQAEFRPLNSTRQYTICCSACKRVHVTWGLAVQPLLAKEKSLPKLTIVEKEG